MEKEIRTVPAEFRVSDDGKITGYAIVFNQWSDDIGGFREIVRPGAVTKTIKETDIRATFNHDSNYVLGRNRSNTLVLREDKKGLSIEIDPPDTQWANDLKTSMRRGDIDQMSFKFGTIKDDWDSSDRKNITRELLEIKLADVSVVTFPAYPQTSAQVRSMVTKLSEPEIEGPEKLDMDVKSKATQEQNEVHSIDMEEPDSVHSENIEVEPEVNRSDGNEEPHVSGHSLRRKKLALLEKSL